MKDIVSQLMFNEWILVFCWFVFLVLSIYFHSSKSRLFFFTLFASALSLALLFSGFTDFLNPWDEQFHALVAKNTGLNLFHPQLYPEGILPNWDMDWANSTTWLHKQPLFTWFMAISVKIFGNSLFAVRFPSMLLFSFLTICVYDIGRIVFNRRSGLFSALLVLHSAYLLLLTGGIQGMDHNDLCFVAFISFSAWAFMRFLREEKRKWLIWIGVFAGCAVLTKWLVGLLVFLPFGIWILSGIRDRHFWVRTKNFLLSLSVCLLVFIPWQIYTFLRFPKLAAYEMQYNSRHFTEVIEGHGGDAFFHYDRLSEIYFNRFDFLLVFFICAAVLIARNYRKFRMWTLFIVVAAVYTFFTLATTKLISYSVPALPFVLLIIGSGIAVATELISIKYLRIALSVIIMAVLCNWMIGMSRVRHVAGFTYPLSEFHVYSKSLKSYMHKNSLHSPKSIIFGHSDGNLTNIAWMFYEADIIYPFYPTVAEINKLQKREFSITLIKKEEMPQELENLKGIRYIEKFEYVPR